MNAVAPSGVVTFLFTDIEGSTRRWETDPEAMRAALATHDEVLRGTIEAQGGRLFKHTGDGVCAVFASPRAAVDAAVGAQRALELPVRMGIATGEAELRGDDYFGAVLNRASRVMAAGHGGQVLVDGATTELLSGVDLRELGPRRLRDIAKPVNVFQVYADGLRSDFPPLRTLDSTPGNLRPPTTSFLGRETELADLQMALKAHRLVTLTGPGGVGKTRLALENAARIAHDFSDGVWVIELASVSDPVAVPDAVASVLGITQQPGMNVGDSVATALEGRSRLLVFDNCEHVLDAAAQMIEKVLAQSSTVAILATSREGLRLPDEQIWPVPSLDVHSSAAMLFVERASTVGSHISLGNDADAVTEICRRLDGIPLAIELAASRMQSMTATELRERLDDRFRLLTGTRRGLERHQTLRHAVQWSYDLLAPDEKAMLIRLSVFAGGFDLAAASAVTGSEDDFATLDVLDALVRKSLVIADRASGRTRFSMLETIRQFADEQLVARGEAETARAAHAQYFVGREPALMAMWDGPRQRESYEWLFVELANLRTAFRWAADHDDLDTAATIAVYTTSLSFWVEQYEPVAWAEELIARARAVEHPRLAQLYITAAECYLTGRIDDAVRYLDAGVDLIESGRFDAVPQAFESWAGGAYAAKGEPERWVELCRTTIGREQSAATIGRAFLVIALVVTGAFDDARAASDSLLAAAEATDNPCARAWAFMGYGSPRIESDPNIARDVLRRGLKIAQESGNRTIEAHFALGLSRLAAISEATSEALDYLTLVIRHYYDAGAFSLMPNPLAVLTALFDRLGIREPAAVISGFAATPLARGGFPEINTAVTHLRGVLGDDGYESFAGQGASMTNAGMARYALDQIELARALL